MTEIKRDTPKVSAKAPAGGLLSPQTNGFYRSLAEFLVANLPNADEVFLGVRRGQVAEIVSVTNLGKSTLLLNLSLCLTAGEPFPPLLPQPSRPMRVLYIDFEATAAELQNDMNIMLNRINNKQAAKDNFIPWVDCEYIDEPLDLGNEAHFEFVLLKAISLQVDLIIIDTMSAAFDMDNENANAEAKRRVMKPLKCLARAAGCAVVFAHHHGKPSEGGSGELAYHGRGASAYGALSRAVYTLTKDATRGTGFVVLTCAKIKGEKIEATLLHYNPTDRWFEICDEIPCAPMVSTYQQVISVVTRQMSNQEIISLLPGLAAKTVENKLSAAYRNGHLERIKPGVYAPMVASQVPYPIREQEVKEV